MFLTRCMLSPNLLALATFSLYDFKASVMKQMAIAYTSVAITFVLLIVVIAYQATFIITYKRSKAPQLGLLNEHLLAQVHPDKSVVTHLVVELPKFQSQPWKITVYIPKTIEAETLSLQ